MTLNYRAAVTALAVIACSALAGCGVGGEVVYVSCVVEGHEGDLNPPVLPQVEVDIAAPAEEVFGAKVFYRRMTFEIGEDGTPDPAKYRYEDRSDDSKWIPTDEYVIQASVVTAKCDPKTAEFAVYY